ncbi:two-component system, OmpR family, sensor histidine kinase TctE [Rhizobium sp. RU33A]|uniref:sensor histidine kinase n=1 Tax=Rhizobium sp. RU33A TaxID=1907413 RepID=UPI0009568700|nr:sensor histidine kinase [Rhizobium sp. RU33A]SIQ86834.1 two-component system, OmpR family, sensor histidine kinase TctE [Rhizobium sp. RU33A]
MTHQPERSGRRLAITIGYWILPAIIVAMASTLWFSTTTIRELADSAYDRSLAGAIRAIDANISSESGGVGVELPYNLFAFFQLTAQGTVYFNVSTSDNLVQIGDVLLPKTPGLESGEIRFHDGNYFGQDIRVGALKRPLDPASPEGVQITIQVAETKVSRGTFQNALIKRAILRDVLVVLILGLLIGLGVFKALQPLNRLKDTIDAREPDDLKPVAVASLPLEVQPLVQAMNGIMQRTAEEASQQRRFLDDASHQLRTPMTILRTQIEYALHQSSLPDVKATLVSSREVLERSIRTTNQLLALAKARTAQGTEIYPQERLDLSETIADTIRMLWPRIRSRKMNCVFDASEHAVIVRVNEGLLREALTNIIDNAVHYAPEGSLITVSLATATGRAEIEIMDEGKGMSEEDIRLAGTRFRSGTSSGSGLGLAIALTVARANGGTMALQNRQDRTGLLVKISLPVSR